jgi:gliding motility-associated lipoprotein GldH
MTSLNGNFLGTGITDIKENKLEYKTNVAFPFKGDYRIRVQHAMRKSRKVDGLIFLNGITDVGLQIEKTD